MNAAHANAAARVATRTSLLLLQESQLTAAREQLRLAGDVGGVPSVHAAASRTTARRGVNVPPPSLGSGEAAGEAAAADAVAVEHTTELLDALSAMSRQLQGACALGETALLD